MTKEILNILLVEDIKTDASLFKKIFEEEKFDDLVFRILWVPSIEDALKALKTSKPAVVVLDLNLPDSSGLETFVKLKDHLGTTPSVVLSSTPDLELITELKMMGVKDYLVKGVATKKELVRSIVTCITRKKSA